MKGRKQGTPKTGGRELGTPNKTTKEIREFYLAFLSNNIDQIQDLFNEVTLVNPVKALEIVLTLSKFILPPVTPEIIDSNPSTIRVIVVEPKKDN
jgi:hypothetical protein